jgi:hypothetical protein
MMDGEHQRVVIIIETKEQRTDQRPAGQVKGLPSFVHGDTGLGRFAFIRWKVGQVYYAQGARLKWPDDLHGLVRLHVYRRSQDVMPAENLIET